VRSMSPPAARPAVYGEPHASARIVELLDARC
jgi:hypothetical protein